MKIRKWIVILTLIFVLFYFLHTFCIWYDDGKWQGNIVVLDNYFALSYQQVIVTVSFVLLVFDPERCLTHWGIDPKFCFNNIK